MYNTLVPNRIIHYMEAAMSVVDKTEGTYVGVKYSKKTCAALMQWAKDNELPNIEETKRLHTTVVYSKKYVEFPNLGDLEPPLIIRPKLFIPALFGEKKDTLVLKFESPWLTKRHELANRLGAAWDWPSYEPHITIADKVTDKLGTIDLEKLTHFIAPLEIVEEYNEPIKSDW